MIVYSVIMDVQKGNTTESDTVSTCEELDVAIYYLGELKKIDKNLNAYIKQVQLKGSVLSSIFPWVNVTTEPVEISDVNSGFTSGIITSESSDILNVKVKKLTEDAIVPTYATDGSGAFDLYANEVVNIDYGKKPILIGTGLAFEIPKGYVMLIVPRSSTGLKTPLRQPNSIGVIDSDYRGEVKLMVENTIDSFQHTYDGEHYFNNWLVQKDTRIAQGFIIKLPQVNFEVVDDLSETDRGEGGFGSTGKE